ncbi:hypothetical protein [Chryseobacterium taichungense]|uniref:hypothetical protein n=1 Tax=Chryseobacterium taichungense TaxID=295069 RepID=UPI0028ACF1F0|nr:hypothetical protein [Chryseobacterium taichungense]
MMKRFYLIWTTLLLLLFVACKELGNDKKKSEKVSFGRTFIDSVIEEDTIKISDSVLLRYSSKLLWFPDLKDTNLLKEIYPGKQITDFSRNGLQDYLKQEKENIYNRMRNSAALPEVKQQQQWSYISLMNVRMNRNNYVSVQYYTSQSGAQDKVSYYYEEKVFDFKNLKKLQLSDIITLSEETVKDILKLNLGKTTIMQQIKTYDPETYVLISAASFPVTRNFYFDDYNLYFHYNANEIIHDDDIGDLIITVPWNDLSDYLKPEFARRMKIN